MTAAGLGTGVSPRTLTLTCAAAKACVATVMAPLGFDYNAGTGKLVVPAGIAAGWILVSNGDGTADWVAP